MVENFDPKLQTQKACKELIFVR